MVKKLVNLVKTDKDNELKDILNTHIRSAHRWGGIRTYEDLINGRFEINGKRVERKTGVKDDIYNKILDYSKDTINELIANGYNDTMNMFKIWKNDSIILDNIKSRLL